MSFVLTPVAASKRRGLRVKVLVVGEIIELAAKAMGLLKRIAAHYDTIACVAIAVNAFYKSLCVHVINVGIIKLGKC